MERRILAKAVGSAASPTNAAAWNGCPLNKRRKTNMKKQSKSIMALVTVIALASIVLMTATGIAGDLEPSAALGPTMKTLDDIYSTSSWSRKLPAAERFVVLEDFNDQAVIDKETGVVWERSPSSSVLWWKSSLFNCLGKNVGGRMGWRLPTIEELASLLDPGVAGSPKLPAGHPFLNVPSADYSIYWSASTDVDDPLFAWVVYLYDGSVHAAYKQQEAQHLFWCVRGGSCSDSQ